MNFKDELTAALDQNADFLEQIRFCVNGTGEIYSILENAGIVDSNGNATSLADFNDLKAKAQTLLDNLEKNKDGFTDTQNKLESIIQNVENQVQILESKNTFAKELIADQQTRINDLMTQAKLDISELKEIKAILDKFDIAEIKKELNEAKNIDKVLESLSNAKDIQSTLNSIESKKQDSIKELDLKIAEITQKANEAKAAAQNLTTEAQNAQSTLNQAKQNAQNEITTSANSAKNEIQTAQNLATNAIETKKQEALNEIKTNGAIDLSAYETKANAQSTYLNKNDFTQTQTTAQNALLKATQNEAEITTLKAAQNTFLTSANAEATYLKKTDQAQVDLSEYYTKEQINSEISAKIAQAQLNSGANGKEVDLSAYLEKNEAEATYLKKTDAPKGADLSEYLKSADAENTYAKKDEIMPSSELDKIITEKIKDIAPNLPQSGTQSGNNSQSQNGNTNQGTNQGSGADSIESSGTQSGINSSGDNSSQQTPSAPIIDTTQNTYPPLDSSIKYKDKNELESLKIKYENALNAEKNESLKQELQEQINKINEAISYQEQEAQKEQETAQKEQEIAQKEQENKATIETKRQELEEHKLDSAKTAEELYALEKELYNLEKENFNSKKELLSQKGQNDFNTQANAELLELESAKAQAQKAQIAKKELMELYDSQIAKEKERQTTLTSTISQNTTKLAQAQQDILKLASADLNTAQNIAQKYAIIPFESDLTLMREEIKTKIQSQINVQNSLKADLQAAKDEQKALEAQKAQVEQELQAQAQKIISVVLETEPIPNGEVLEMIDEIQKNSTFDFVAENRFKLLEIFLQTAQKLGYRDFDPRARAMFEYWEDFAKNKKTSWNWDEASASKISWDWMDFLVDEAIKKYTYDALLPHSKADKTTYTARLNTLKTYKSAVEAKTLINSASFNNTNPFGYFFYNSQNSGIIGALHHQIIAQRGYSSNGTSITSANNDYKNNFGYSLPGFLLYFVRFNYNSTAISNNSGYNTALSFLALAVYSAFYCYYKQEVNTFSTWGFIKEYLPNLLNNEYSALNATIASLKGYIEFSYTNSFEINKWLRSEELLAQKATNEIYDKTLANEITKLKKEQNTKLKEAHKAKNEAGFNSIYKEYNDKLKSLYDKFHTNKDFESYPQARIAHNIIENELFGLSYASGQLIQQYKLTPNAESYTHATLGNFAFIPRFYFKTGDILGAFEISFNPLPGFMLHRAFINNGKIIEGFFVEKTGADKTLSVLKEHGATALSLFAYNAIYMLWSAKGAYLCKNNCTAQTNSKTNIYHNFTDKGIRINNLGRVLLGALRTSSNAKILKNEKDLNELNSENILNDEFYNEFAISQRLDYMSTYKYNSDLAPQEFEYFNTQSREEAAFLFNLNKQVRGENEGGFTNAHKNYNAINFKNKFICGYGGYFGGLKIGEDCDFNSATFRAMFLPN